MLQLMQLIDEAIKEVERMEDRLQAYDDVIMVRWLMHVILQFILQVMLAK